MPSRGTKKVAARVPDDHVTAQKPRDAANQTMKPNKMFLHLLDTSWALEQLQKQNFMQSIKHFMQAGSEQNIGLWVIHFELVHITVVSHMLNYHFKLCSILSFSPGCLHVQVCLST